MSDKKEESFDYSLFYQRITRYYRQTPGAVSWLRWTNRTLEYVMYLLYLGLLVALALCGDWLDMLLTIIVPAMCFMWLSALRRQINRPRPYERWPIQPLIPKDTLGSSMPSRHVFSASLISMASWQLSPLLSLAALVLSLVLAYCRVVGGVHYVKDVLVGFALGLLSAWLLLYLVSIC